MTKVKAWIEATRPRTLPVSVAGVLAGCACAIMERSFRLLPFLICLLFALTAQIVSNFANEYYDYKAGFDRKGRAGFRRGVTEGDISPAAMKRATYSLLFLDCLLGCSLIIWGGWQLIPVGILIALFAVAYSTGPYPLSHHGLGDIAVIIFFGIVPVMYTCYVQTGNWDSLPLTLNVGFATGLLAANVLIVNNYRDADDDRAVGKHTSVVILGRPAMAAVYFFFFTAALAGIYISTFGRLPLWTGLFWALFEVLYILTWRRIIRASGSELNPLLKRTAMLMLGVSFSLISLSIAFT